MTWILLAISSYLLGGMVNLIDKYMVDKRMKNPFVFMLWSCIFGIWVVVLIPFFDFYIPSIQVLSFVFLGSLAYLLASLLYVKAITIEEISRINILFQLIPVFTLVIVLVLFNDYLLILEFIAFLLLLSGGIIASIHFDKIKFTFSKAFWWMTLACFLYAIYGVIFDRLLINDSPYVLVVYFTIFNFILSCLFLIFLKKENQKEIKSANLNLYSIVFLVAFIDLIAVLFNMKALSLGHVSLVYSLEGVQILFVFFVAVLLTVFFPKIIKEDIDKKNILLKIVSLVFILAGILFLYLY
jgi:drug/metabolite transporter (DMT)-like permease